MNVENLNHNGEAATQEMDIERAACMILRHASPYNLLLRDWIEALARDLNDARNLEEYLATEGEHIAKEWSTGQLAYAGLIAELTEHRTFAVPLPDHYRGSVSEQIADRHHADKYPVHDDDRIWWDIDHEVWQLATALTLFRRSGRPSGVAATTLARDETQAATITVTSSLASAVARYALQMQACISKQIERIEDIRQQP